MTAIFVVTCLFASVPAQAQEHLDPPGTPQNVEVTVGDAKLTLTWQALSAWGSGTALGYQVDWYSGAEAPAHTSAEWQVVEYNRRTDASPTETSFTFSGNVNGRVHNGRNWVRGYHTVANGNQYYLRLRAVSTKPGDPTDILVSDWVTVSGTAEATQSTNADLSALTAGSATSAGGQYTDFSIGTFAATTTSYTASVANDQTHVKLTPTVADTGKATVGVRKGMAGSFTPVTSGQASSAIALDVGANTLVVRVTAQDTTTTQDYTVTVTRRMAQQTRSSNADLSALTAGSATSSGGQYTDFSIGTFAATTTSYTASVANARTHVKLTPTVADTGKATVAVRKGQGSFSTVTSGQASGAIALDVGSNAITVRVTAEDTTTKDYTVTITRRTAQQTRSSNADLGALTASSATSSTSTFSALPLAPSPFSASRTSYTTSVTYARTHVKLTPTVADTGKATVGVRKGNTGNFSPVASGTASGAITLDVGSNAITVQVTAEDGSTTKDYTVTITRQTPTVSLSAPSQVLEGSSVTVTARLSAALSSAVTIPVTVSTSGSNTAEPGDVGTLTSITIASGQTTGTGTIMTNHDSGEDDETFTIALGTLPSSVTPGIPNSVQITISDDDKPHTLSVDATPPCGSSVPGTSMQPTYSLVLTPAPAAVTETEYRWVTDSTEGRWLEATVLSIRPGNGRSGFLSPDNTFAQWRNAYAGFRGLEFRLTDTPSVTAQCFWTFTEDPVPPQTPPNTGGTGTGGGGGGAPPTGGDSPSPEEPQDPEQTDDCGDNDRENLVSFYDATDGDNWDDNTDWKSEEPLGQWFGVDTDEDGEVLSLRLEENNLSGDMPTKELLCLNEDTELKELALWDNEGLSGKEPDELMRAVERAVLRDVAEALSLNAGWFDDYEDPFSFSDWHGGVMTDEEGRVTGLDFTGEGITGEIPQSVFVLERLTAIDTGCKVTVDPVPERVRVTMPEGCSDASLQNIEISPGELEFDPMDLSYEVPVGYGPESVTVTPTASESEAVITVNGNTVGSGEDVEIELNEEEPSIVRIVVTAPDGMTTRTYGITVARCGEDDMWALSRFYEAVGGQNWNDNTNWNSQEPLDRWFGVGTDEDGRVISLDLEGNGLSGETPRELVCLSEIKELALWDNDGLSGKVPDELMRAVERAVLRDVAEALELNPGWFDDYEDPFNFSDWHEGVTTDDDGRVTELDFTGEDITGVIPGSVFELKRLTAIETGCEVTLEIEAPGRVSVMTADDCVDETVSSGGGGCAVGRGDSSVSGFGLFLVTLLVFAALGRKRARSS